MSDNFIWTKHVEARSLQRGVSGNEVWSTLRYPDKTEKIASGKYKFAKNIAGKNIVLIALPQGNQWVILTTWIKGRSSASGYTQNFLTQTLIKWLNRLFNSHGRN